jgi:hypothetical protein
MKRVHKISIFVFVVLLVFGFGYVKGDLIEITGRATGVGIANCHIPCQTEINGSPVEIPVGQCGPYLPEYCPELVEEQEDCGFFIDNCTVCGCPEGNTCQEDGNCLSDGSSPSDTYMGCVEVVPGSFACMEKQGSSPDECSSDGDCYSVSHIECNEGDLSCEEVPGPGRDECDSSDECYSGYINRCSDLIWNMECQIGNAPVYCSEGEFVADCSECGCPPGLSCMGDGNCAYATGSSESDFDETSFLMELSLTLGGNQYVKTMVNDKLQATLQFERVERPLIKFVRPTLTRISAKMPTQTEIEIRDSLDGIQYSPVMGKFVVINGLASGVDGVQYSPGSSMEGFQMIIGVNENNTPIIDLNL